MHTFASATAVLVADSLSAWCALSSAPYHSRFKVRVLNQLGLCKTLLSQHLAELRAIAERSNKLGATVARLVDAEAQIDGEIELLAAVEHEITRTINAVQDERLQLVLYRRYVLGEKWEQIAVNLNLDYRWVLRLHGRALAAVADVLKEESA